MFIPQRSLINEIWLKLIHYNWLFYHFIIFVSDKFHYDDYEDDNNEVEEEDADDDDTHGIEISMTMISESCCFVAILLCISTVFCPSYTIIFLVVLPK